MSGPEKRLVRSKSGLRIMPIKESERSPFELREPEWVKDAQSSDCTGCKTKFDFVNRKHHCRRCGHIFCNSCSKARQTLPRMCFLDPVRLCSDCAKKTVQENQFYENDLKILTTGVLLQVIDLGDETKSRVLHCCLSLDQCRLMFSGTISQSIPLINITTVSNMETDENENRSLPSLSFVVNGEDTVTELRMPDNSNAVTSNFLSALQTALQMTQEAKSIIGLGN